MWLSRGNHRWLMAVVLLTLAGCGFKFRTTPEFPAQMDVIHIEAADRYSPFYRDLVAKLRRSGVMLTAEPAQARTIVKILTDDTGRRLLAVSGRNVPVEYEVFYRVRFAVDVDGVEVVPVEQLLLSRDYAYDETEVLGKDREEESIRQAIASDLVGLVTRRLTAVR